MDSIYSAESDQRLVVIAFEKQQQNSAVGIAVFKLKDIHSSRVLSFPLLKVVKFAALTNRNKYWEVTYCVRKPNFRGRCVGAICLTAGLEGIRGLSQRDGYTANVWLVVSGSFQNPRALRLYMDYGFSMQGVYEDEVSLVMLLQDLDDEKYQKIRMYLERYGTQAPRIFKKTACLRPLPSIKPSL